jgi:hypothetical protein
VGTIGIPGNFREGFELIVIKEENRSKTTKSYHDALAVAGVPRYWSRIDETRPRRTSGGEEIFQRMINSGFPNALPWTGARLLFLYF